jgi:hypothetical protein
MCSVKSVLIMEQFLFAWLKVLFVDLLWEKTLFISTQPRVWMHVCLRTAKVEKVSAWYGPLLEIEKSTQPRVWMHVCLRTAKVEKVAAYYGPLLEIEITIWHSNYMCTMMPDQEQTASPTTPNTCQAFIIRVLTTPGLVATTRRRKSTLYKLYEYLLC